MSVDKMIRDAVKVFGYDVENGVSHSKSRPYFTFSYITIPVNFGDDEPAHERYIISLHFYAPLTLNITNLKQRIKTAVHKAGFNFPAEEDASDEDGRHIVFEFERTEVAVCGNADD